MQVKSCTLFNFIGSNERLVYQDYSMPLLNTYTGKCNYTHKSGERFCGQEGSFEKSMFNYLEGQYHFTWRQSL